MHSKKLFSVSMLLSYDDVYMLITRRSTHTNPVRTHDALTGLPTRFRIFVNAEPSDNPMQSQISGHIGGNGNLMCRKCEVGGTTEHKETNDGFHSIFSVSDPGKHAE